MFAGCMIHGAGAGSRAAGSGEAGGGGGGDGGGGGSVSFWGLSSGLGLILIQETSNTRNMKLYFSR